MVLKRRSKAAVATTQPWNLPHNTTLAVLRLNIKLSSHLIFSA
jgi:hypothetical protein